MTTLILSLSSQILISSLLNTLKTVPFFITGYIFLLINSSKDDFYVTVSRLVSYKKISLIVQAFNKLGYPLIIIGDGPEIAKLRLIAKPNIQILGAQKDTVVEKYVAKEKAFIYAACEDFGIALVEAQACGTPVIAYGNGGALETVIDVQQDAQNGTGILFKHQTCETMKY